MARKGHIPGDDGGEPSRPQRPRVSLGGGRGPTRSWLQIGAWVVGALLIAFIVGQFVSFPGQAEELTYSQFLNEVDAGVVTEVTIGPDGRVDGERVDGQGGSFTTTIPTAVDNAELLPELRDADVQVDAEPPSDGGLGILLINLLPFLLIIGAIWWFSRRAQGGMKQITGLGKSKAKAITKERPDTSFDDIAGYENMKSEVKEVVDYLRDPSRFDAVGARGPGGLLLVGPPGTGKTLLARAVAGEADVPFFSVAGSEFVEMIVGVGASRVRDLFQKARKQAPVIVFIDELDSIGRRRGGSTTIGSNNEQEQTLNQLLSEMDGFDPSEGIVVMAATNRPEMLDEALKRPGRFDREIEVPLPTQDERRQILELHAADKPLTDDVELEPIARATPGFTGADLENLTNEAAFRAARERRERIRQQDFEDARDRVLLGRRQDTSILRPEERDRVAVHEAGHALVAALMDETDPVAKITILPTRQALGLTEQRPVDERRLHTEGWLHDALAVRMGGRVAERLVLGQGSSGAANDLSNATQLAAKMVRDLGLSDDLGPIGYASQEDGGSVPPSLTKRPYAEETQARIDQEVARLLREAEATAEKALSEHRDKLEELVDELLEQETVDGAVVYELVGRDKPT